MALYEVADIATIQTTKKLRVRQFVRTMNDRLFFVKLVAFTAYHRTIVFPRAIEPRGETGVHRYTAEARCPRRASPDRRRGIGSPPRWPAHVFLVSCWCLQLASRRVRSRKHHEFIAALRKRLARFRPSFAGLVPGAAQHDRVVFDVPRAA